LRARALRCIKRWVRAGHGPCAESNQHPQIVTSLPGLGPSAQNEIGQYIPLATKHSIKFAGAPADLYNVGVTQFSQFMHPDLPGKTDFFGYTDLFTFDRKYLAGAIVAKGARRCC